MNQQEVTDSAFMGPWLANNIRESDGLMAMMSYWCLSDVFEEQGVVKTPFYGGYGLIAERDIPKAAFRDFELLHRLGTKRFMVDSENALVTQADDGHLVVALWNYAEPGETVAPKTFKLAIKGMKVKKYRYQFVAPGASSPLEAWKNMGSPVSPAKEQIKALINASVLPKAKMEPIEHSIALVPQTLAVLEVER